MTSAYAERRARLLAQLPPGAVVALTTAPEVPRNGDSDYPYRYDSYFYYLTGFTEPDSALVLVAAHGESPLAGASWARSRWSATRNQTGASLRFLKLSEYSRLSRILSRLLRLMDS